MSQNRSHAVMTRRGTQMRRVNVPGCLIALRPADAAVYYAALGYPPRSIAKLMRGAITAHGAAQAISQARARGENLPSFTAVPNIIGRLSKLPQSSLTPGDGASETAGRG